MTDIRDWPSLVHCARLRSSDSVTGKYLEGISFADYVLIPLNPYQMGNLLDALTQAVDTGDWYWEFVNIVIVAMQKAGLTELTSNRGKTFLLADLRKGVLAK